MTETPDLQEFHALTELDELRRLVADLQGRLRKERNEKEALVEAVFAGARDALAAYGPIPPVPAPAKDTRKRKGEVALWHLTDWQGSKATSSYSTEVMQERVMRFCDKAAKLTDIQRADHPVDECVILFGGDMCEGLFNYPAQLSEIDSSLFGQFTAVARLEADVVRRALATYQTVRVIQEWGNHGRIGSKRADVPRADNMDRMIGTLAREIVGEEPRLTGWEIGDEDIQRVEIGAYRALLIHGDEIGRGGQVSINTLINHAKGWRSGAYPWPFLDIYAGHFHSWRDLELPWGGCYYQTGSPETDNRYARDSMASSSLPTQRLHFVDPAAGMVAAQYRVRID